MDALPSDNRTYPSLPRVGVGVIVWRADRVLLVKRGRPPNLGEWSLPGGAQELGETVFETAIREVREETGVDIEPTDVVTVVDSITRDGEDRVRYHYTLVEVAAEWRDGEARPSDDAADVRWAGLAEIDGLVAWEETRRVIRLAAESTGRWAAMPPAGDPVPAVGPSLNGGPLNGPPTGSSPRLRQRPRLSRLMRSPLGALIARPWLDEVTLRLLADWLFPMSRAWAAATVSGGDPDVFAAETPVGPPALARTGRLIDVLQQVDDLTAQLAAADEDWHRTFFGAAEASAADCVRSEDARLAAANAHGLARLRFALFAHTHKLPACRWAIPTEEEVKARHGDRLADPGTAYELPGHWPAVIESRSVDSDIGVEYWLKFDCPEPSVGGQCWARVFEPEHATSAPTVVHLHGICVETDHIRAPLREIEAFTKRGLRVVAMEAPGHGRRRWPGRYGGEGLVASSPLGSLDHFAAHVREVALVTEWARRTSAGPVGWSGTSLGALTCQLSAHHARSWPAVCAPDALLLSTTAEGIEDIALSGAFARAFGVGDELTKAGWTAEKLRRWQPLMEPEAPPPAGAKAVFMVLGSKDTVTPFDRGLAMARRWAVPEEQVFVRRQGHFSVPAGLMVDEAPIAAFCDRLLSL